MWSTTITTTTVMGGVGEGGGRRVCMLVGGNYNAVANVATLRMRNVRIAHVPHSPPLAAARTTSLMRYDRPQKCNII